MIVLRIEIEAPRIFIGWMRGNNMVDQSTQFIEKTILTIQVAFQDQWR